MNELPKELTTELLSDVLGEEVIQIELKPRINNHQRIFITSLIDDIETEESINLDTLTRLCKEWCLKQELVHEIDIYFDGDCYIELIGWCPEQEEAGCLIYSSNHSNTELEAVLKATAWVMEKKDD